MAGLRRGDSRAFEEAFVRHHARIHAFLLRLSGSRWVAEDLCQETFLRLARHAMRLEPDTRLAPWLLTVARNCYRSYRRFALLDRQRLVEYGLLPPATAPSPEGRAAAGESAARLEEALARLPLAYREALLLVGVEGMSAEEAARVLGLSVENLRQRVHRGRVLMRELMQEADAGAAAADREAP